MKKIIIAMFITGLFLFSATICACILCLMGGCHKEKTEKPIVPPAVVQSNQDAKLLGVWVCDSSDIAGSMMIMQGMYQDTLKVSPSSYENIFWVGIQATGYGFTWHTVGDTIFTNGNEKYKYIVTNSNLYTYQKPFIANQYIIRWYHKK